MTEDDLYTLPRDEFVPARRDLARAARAAGDREAAARIEKLPKPTTAAWLLNRLVRAHPDEVEELLAVGDGLRTAHEDGAGSRLRELVQERTRLVDRLVTLAGEALSEAITRELAEMLSAAVADPSSGERLRAARLAAARDLVVAEPWPGLTIAPRSDPAPRRESPSARRKAALTQAKAAVKDAEAQRAEADRAVGDAETAVAEAESRVRELNAALDAAEHAELDARRTLQTARRDAKAAERAAGLAWRKLQQVESAED
ncbi:hypothetical protein V5P93_005467 [Actinokineospora auranticolor]|uniref:hypothetical protein n=1 Tax=Actinokineospora auranticolor TaxID=155976 RepID=UPI0011B0105F|nr:hypothetical protein [Actinokineospora auranticolor]